MPLLTPNFDSSEFDVAGEKFPPQYFDNRLALAKLAQWLRTTAGTSGIITSAYRSPSHNAEVGGAETSQHMKGEALDIVFRMTPLRVMGTRILQAVQRGVAPSFGQLILYADKGHIHVSLPTLGARNGELRYSFTHGKDRVYPFLTAQHLNDLPNTTGAPTATTIGLVGAVVIIGFVYLALRRY